MLPPSARRDLEEVAGAEIVHRDDGAERFAVDAHRREPDQVGVVEFVGLSRRQAVARHVELDVASALRPRRGRRRP